MPTRGVRAKALNGLAKTVKRMATGGVRVKPLLGSANTVRLVLVLSLVRLCYVRLGCGLMDLS